MGSIMGDEIPDSRDYQQLCDRIESLEDKLNPESDHYVLKPFIPFIQGAAGINLLWKFFVFVGGAILLWMQIKGVFHDSGVSANINLN